MIDKKAIQAVYADYKRVKGRKVHQICFEVPSETWPQVYAILGEPNIDESAWFGIAAMNVVEKAPTPKDNSKNYAGEMVMLCKEVPFQAFIGVDRTLDCPEKQQKHVQEVLKRKLGIKSKSELNNYPSVAKSWRELVREYKAWMIAA